MKSVIPLGTRVAEITDEIADDNIMLLDVVNMYLDAEDDEEVNDE